MSRRRRFAVVLVVVGLLTVGLVVPVSATIRLKNLAPGHDQLNFHGRLGATPGDDVVDHGITVDMRNPNGVFVSVSLPPGACVPRPHAKYCKFVDKDAAKRREGIASFKMTFDKGKIWMTAYGDLSGATPLMSLFVTLNGKQYSVTANFRQTPSGRVLTNQDWP